MMDLLGLQDALKNMSEQQLIQEMQMPSGQVPPFLVLSEITRRRDMQTAFAGQDGQQQSTVAEDAVAAAGVPGPQAQAMAGAMAPNTDMAGDTGALPQQSALPAPREPVLGMAGGGIVALQQGGQVNSRPALVVRGGRQFAQMPDGSMIPLGELGIADSLYGGYDAAPQLGSGVNPSYRERDTMPPLNQRPEYAPPANPAAAGYQRGIPTAPPSISDAAGYQRGIPTAPPSISDAQMQGIYDQLGQYEAPTRPLAGIAPQVTDYLPVPFADPLPTATGEYMSAPMTEPVANPEDVRRMEAGLPLTDHDFGPDPEGRQGSGGPVGQFVLDGLRNTASIWPSVLEAAGMVEGAPGQDVIPDDASLSGIPGAELLPPAAALGAEANAAGAGSGGGGGGGGGGISMSASASGGPSDFEQEILGMLDAREKRATQDKWLALAQAGMALMSSSQPTIGGAMGEAGLSGLASLREGQASAEDDRLGMLTTLEGWRQQQAQMELQRQAMAARAAAGGGSGAVDPMANYGDLSAGGARALDRIDARLEALDMMPRGKGVDALAIEREREYLLRERDAVMYYQGGVSPMAAGSGAERLGGR